MNSEKDHNMYTAEDIKRYLSGDMSHKEMYAIEKAALDDPFLAEAIEGYESMPEKEWSTDLSSLRKKLEEVENKPIVPLYGSPVTKWWKAAAAVLVITSSVIVAYLFTKKNTPATEPIASANISIAADSMTIAKTDSSPNTIAGNVTTGLISQNQSLSATSGAFSSSDSTRQVLLADAGFAEKRNEPSGGLTSVDDNHRDYKAQTKDKNVAAAGIARTDSASYDQSYALKEIRENNNQLDQRNVAAENPGFKKVNPVIYNGQVTTADNTPVANARVSLPQNSKPIYTDNNGNFSLPADGSVVNVSVASPGYATQQFDLQNNAVQNKIVLQPNDMAAKEVSVGRKREAQKPQLKKDSITEQEDGDDEEEAEPAGGWIVYNDYLQNNLVLPDEAKEKNIHGEVRLLVELTNKGDILKIKVDKSLCNACDAEAMRLVKEGPKWEVKKNKATNTKVKIKF